MGKPPKLYSESTANEIASKLDYLAQNPKGLQVKELVSQLRPKVEAAQASGHSLEDIVGVFKAKGVDLTLNTLKQYLRESRSLPPGSEQSSSPDDSKSSKPKRLKGKPSPEPEPQSIKADKPSKPEGESKPQPTNTNEEGFQEMRSNDDL